MRKLAFLVLALLATGRVFAADPGHAIRQAGQEIVFHYGVVPAEVVLAHAGGHEERKMHEGSVPRGSSHVVVALFDAARGERVADAEVTATISLLGGSSVTRRLEPMAIANQPSFGAFFQLGVPGIYRLHFEARTAANPRPQSADFEYRVSPESRR